MAPADGRQHDQAATGAERRQTLRERAAHVVERQAERMAGWGRHPASGCRPGLEHLVGMRDARASGVPVVPLVGNARPRHQGRCAAADQPIARLGGQQAVEVVHHRVIVWHRRAHREDGLHEAPGAMRCSSHRSLPLGGPRVTTTRCRRRWISASWCGSSSALTGLAMPAASAPEQRPEALRHQRQQRAPPRHPAAGPACGRRWRPGARAPGNRRVGHAQPAPAGSACGRNHSAVVCGSCAGADRDRLQRCCARVDALEEGNARWPPPRRAYRGRAARPQAAVHQDGTGHGVSRCRNRAPRAGADQSRSRRERSVRPPAVPRRRRGGPPRPACPSGRAPRPRRSRPGVGGRARNDGGSRPPSSDRCFGQHPLGRRQHTVSSAATWCMKLRISSSTAPSKPTSPSDMQRSRPIRRRRRGAWAHRAGWPSLSGNSSRRGRVEHVPPSSSCDSEGVRVRRSASAFAQVGRRVGRVAGGRCPASVRIAAQDIIIIMRVILGASTEHFGLPSPTSLHPSGAPAPARRVWLPAGAASCGVQHCRPPGRQAGVASARGPGAAWTADGAWLVALAGGVRPAGVAFCGGLW